MSRETLITNSEKLLNKSESYCTSGFLQTKREELKLTTADFKAKNNELKELKTSVTEDYEQIHTINDSINETVSDISNVLKSEIDSDSLAFRDFFPVKPGEMKRLNNREKVTKLDELLKAYEKHTDVVFALKFKDKLKTLREDYFKLIEKIEKAETKEKELRAVVVSKEEKLQEVYDRFEKIMEALLPKE